LSYKYRNIECLQWQSAMTESMLSGQNSSVWIGEWWLNTVDFARVAGQNLASQKQGSALIVELFAIWRLDPHLKRNWQSTKNCETKILKETMRNYGHWTSCPFQRMPPLSKILSKKDQKVWYNISLSKTMLVNTFHWMSILTLEIIDLFDYYSKV
jgi:hypothetical protein